MNQICKEMNTFNLQGDIIPISWYENIKKGKNKPDLEACLILANIIYWYRPIEIRDNNTGKIIEYKQKFKADKLQKSYQHYADFLGIPKSSAKRAIDNLIKYKLIKREFRNFATGDGLYLTNVMYLEPILENIKKISYKKTEPPPQEKTVPPPQEKLEGVMQKNSDTNTEITTEITTNNNINTKPTRHPIFSDKIEKKVNKQIKPSENIDAISVIDRWNSHECLIRHKKATIDHYFQKKHLSAVMVNGVENTLKAIDEYARVLGNDHYWFSHRWSLFDFLIRGLLKFVPESKPLENFKKSQNDKKTGKSLEEMYPLGGARLR